MNLLEKFTEFIKKENLFQPKDKLLLAVSGGVDSVVLCALCKQAGYDFVIAHCNFQLRGAESERDEAFVQSLAEKYAVEFFVKKFDTEKYAIENKLSIQIAARELRYAWFNEIIGGHDVEGATGNKKRETRDLLLTAHHANDNIETLLMNFFKGTGINGLHGILPKQQNIIRPLLFAKKDALLAFATENKLDFVEDSSNASDKYTRNYFRNELIPGLQKVFPQVEENMLHNIERFKAIETLYRQSVEVTKKKLLEIKKNEIHIPVLKLLNAKPLNTLVYEIIKDYGFTPHQTEEVVGLLKSETGKFVQSGTHRIIKNRNWLIIAPNANQQANIILIEEADKLVEFQLGTIKLKQLSTSNCQLSTSNMVAQLDAGMITFPLLLRKRKPGDYFYPLGMRKKKKLNRFLSDLKLSLTKKENTWVIEMDKKIIWIVGQRIDDRYKITGNTKNIFQLTLAGAE